MRDHDGSQKKIKIFFLTVLLILLFDRVSKLFFLYTLELGESIPVVKDIFHFTLVFNTGIAFGLFKDQGILFTIIPIMAITLIGYHIYSIRNNTETDYLYIFAFALIMSGAAGNLIDRLVYGHVVDFIDFRVWPVFNVADSAITIGAIIIALKCVPLFSKQAR